MRRLLPPLTPNTGPAGRARQSLAQSAVRARAAARADAYSTDTQSVTKVTRSGNTLSVRVAVANTGGPAGEIPTTALGVVQGDIDASGPRTLEPGDYVFSTGTASDAVTPSAANTITL